MIDRATFLNSAAAFIHTGKDAPDLTYFSSLTNADIAITCTDLEGIAQKIITANSNENHNDSFPAEEIKVISEALESTKQIGYTAEWFNLLAHCQSIRAELLKTYGTHKIVSLEEVFLGSQIYTKYSDTADLKNLYSLFKNPVTTKIDTKIFEYSANHLKQFVEGYYVTLESKHTLEDKEKTDQEKQAYNEGLSKAAENACPYAIDLYFELEDLEESDKKYYLNESSYYHGYRLTLEGDRLAHLGNLKTLEGLKKATIDGQYEAALLLSDVLSQSAESPEEENTALEYHQLAYALADESKVLHAIDNNLCSPLSWLYASRYQQDAATFYLEDKISKFTSDTPEEYKIKIAELLQTVYFNHRSNKKIFNKMLTLYEQYPSKTITRKIIDYLASFKKIDQACDIAIEYFQKNLDLEFFKELYGQILIYQASYANNDNYKTYSEVNLKINLLFAKHFYHNMTQCNNKKLSNFLSKRLSKEINMH